MTLITLPRRFGKTLNMNMVECFFSYKFADKGALFEGLSIWHEQEYQQLQGSYPVIFLSFANIKATEYNNFIKALLIDDVDSMNEFINRYVAKYINVIN